MDRSPQELKHDKDAVKCILSMLDETDLMTRCGVGRHAIRAAKWQGKFPSGWERTLKGMLPGDVVIPDHLFSWNEEQPRVKFKHPKGLGQGTNTQPSQVTAA